MKKLLALLLVLAMALTATAFAEEVPATEEAPEETVEEIVEAEEETVVPEEEVTEEATEEEAPATEEEAPAAEEEAPAEDAIPSPPGPAEIIWITPEQVTGTVYEPGSEGDTDGLIQALLEQIGQSDLEEVFSKAGPGYGRYELVELVGLVLQNYEFEMGDVVLNIKFASAFAPGDDLATLLGIITTGANNAMIVDWAPVRFEINEDTTLTVTLKPEQALAVMANPAVLAVLKAK